jgi:mannose-1-phosphate guanylyltransferase/mannose-6-phosphate isomerase
MTTLYPVIMCGGAGTRLWPASRPSYPKQFLPLTGERSLFQDTVLRVAPLAEGGGRLIIVGGVRHATLIRDQLAELGIDAVVLLEPVARDSAAAMVAAAVWSEARDPEAINLFVASDHFIPDHAAFRDAARLAAAGAATGDIVTLGIRPLHPSPAYGYIRPTGPGLSRVEAFVEKPDSATAQTYIDAGYLWNSGNFIVRARTLLDEVQSEVPDILSAVRAASQAANGDDVRTLGPDFARSPAVSIDYAVMEKTRRASVLAVDFDWSDVGAWDSVAETGRGDLGQAVRIDAHNSLVRAPEGTMVALVGVPDVAVIVEADAVLVCALDRSQAVKDAVKQVGALSPAHLDVPSIVPSTPSLPSFATWLTMSALPLWATLGQRDDGAFVEALTNDGGRVQDRRRARVQARQVYVYAQAGLCGWLGPWRSCVERGLERLMADYIRDDGLCRTLLDGSGAPLDETAMIYDQAFVLLALATATQAGIPDLAPAAVRLRQALLSGALPNGLFREGGPHPYQANAHMHLLEACLAWEDRGDDQWRALADLVAERALDLFVDDSGGFLREFFTPDWQPAPGADGDLIEPGHQFEWSWLLETYGSRRGHGRARATAVHLYRSGLRGVCPNRGVAMNALNVDGSVRSAEARLWPQTEWLKAAAALDLSQDRERAERALRLYLTADGRWHDRLKSDGTFVPEASPASSFYHIMMAFAHSQRCWLSPS